MAGDAYTIRPMRADEIALAVDWAAAEGWNPGLHDAACFATVDPEGFLIGELDGKPAATISCVNYDDRFAFLGFYIVRPDLRGRGFGLTLWQAAIAHAGARTIGLDGVVAQQDNYRKSGFILAYRNVRYGGRVAAAASVPARFRSRDIPLAVIAADDATVFPAPRDDFLRAWIGTHGPYGRALVRDGALAAWGVIRPCRAGLQDRPAGGRRPRGGRGGVRRADRGRRRRRGVSRRSGGRTARRSRSRSRAASRRCSRPRACIPGRSARSRFPAFSASRRSNSAEPVSARSKSACCANGGVLRQCGQKRGKRRSRTGQPAPERTIQRAKAIRQGQTCKSMGGMPCASFDSASPCLASSS